MVASPLTYLYRSLSGLTGELNPGTGDWSFSFWFKCSQTNATICRTARNGTGSSGGVSVFIPASGIIRTVISTDSNPTNSITTIGTISVVDAVWRHCVVTFDRDGDCTIYINGEVDGSANISSYAGLNIGNNLGGFYFNTNITLTTSAIIEIDEFGYFDKVLSAAEIAWLGTNTLYLDPVADALRASVVGYYELEDENDSGPNGYHLTNTNGVTFSVGQLGNAAEFQEGAEQILSRASPDLDIGTGSFSISAWVLSPDTSIQQCICGKGIPSVEPGWQLRTFNNQVRFEMYDGVIRRTITSTSASDFDIGWHHIVLTANRAGNAIIYFDNTVIGQLSISSASDSLENVRDFMVGRAMDDGSGTKDYPFVGQIDELAIFNRVLTVEEIAYLHNTGIGRSLY